MRRSPSASAAHGEEVAATTYLVKPDQRRTGIATSAAYVSWIIYGLRAHGVPEDWVWVAKTVSD